MEITLHFLTGHARFTFFRCFASRKKPLHHAPFLPATLEHDRPSLVDDDDLLAGALHPACTNRCD